MPYDVYRDALAIHLSGSFATLDQAIAALLRGQSLVLPDSYPVALPVNLNTDGISLFAARDGTQVILGSGVTQFTARGEHAVAVSTSDAGARVRGGDAGLTVNGGAGRDIVVGGAGDDGLWGGAGNDNLQGGGGNDLIVAGPGNDAAFGGAGADLIVMAGGRNSVTTGSGADLVMVDLTQAGMVTLTDFNPGSGDRIVLSGHATITDFASLMAQARISVTGTGPAQLTLGAVTIRVQNAPATVFDAGSVVFDLPQDRLTFADVGSFLASGMDRLVDSVTIGQTLYHLRNAEPLHVGHKHQDTQGRWWSPDMFVVVAAGQSNMDGGASGGPLGLSGDVVAYDWVNDRLIQADYTAAPANGAGVRTGTVIRNNLYFPFAEQIAAELDRPVLVIAHPVSGSRIDSWLASGTGNNWAALNGDVAHALALAGQDNVDSFIWLQGESDYPITLAQFQNLFLEFVSQVRAQDWAGSDMAFLAGELSRLGINSAQNAAFQAIELNNPDAMLRFVSSVGLTATDLGGVHFDAASLIAYGARYWQVFAQLTGLTPPPEPNAAPTLAPGASPPTAITMTEGDRLVLDVAQYFTDPDGDQMWFYSYLARRGIVMETTIDNRIVLTPGFDAAGTHTLTIHASDYDLDGASYDVTLNVTDRAPTVQLYSNSTFATALGSYRDIGMALAAAGTNRGIDVLSQAAMSGETAVLSFDSLRIRGGDGITGNFALAAPHTRAWLYGEADFNLTGNALDNLFEGNAGDNRLTGLGGRDRLLGHGGNDLLVGGQGDDTVHGGAGNDILDTGAGNDMAWGDAGADVFVWRAGEGQLQVRDLAIGQDLIRIDGFAGIDDFADLAAQAGLFQSGDRAVLDLGGDRLMLSGINVTQITAGIFDFA